ncbi:MAG: hypothetical protein K6E61_02100 [Bacteroidales bacterium]|nr:hypothetical protein [Bacteroidales bacterium]
MGTKKILTALLMVTVSSSCLKINIEPPHVVEVTTCGMYAGGVKFVKAPKARISWASTKMGAQPVIFLRADVFCSEEGENPVSWLGTDDNGNELCLGPAMWLCIPDNLKKDDTVTITSTSNAVAITKKIVVKDGDSDYYTFYAYHSSASFRTVTITCLKNTQYEIKVSFEGEIAIGPSDNQKIVKIEKGQIHLSRDTQNGKYNKYDNWTKDRDQYQYWL